MYIPVTTEDYNSAIKAKTRTFDTKCDVIDGATTYTLVGSGISGDIISMQWNNVVCSNDGLQIGTSCMDEFRMEYRNKPGLPSLMDKEIHPYVGLVIPKQGGTDTTVWIPLGVFWVTNASSTDEDRTFSLVAYDGMQKFIGNVVWSDIGITEFPVNAWTLLTAIATHFGVTISYDDMSYNLLSSEEYQLTTADGYNLVVGSEIDSNKNTSLAEPLEGTYRDYIGWIAGLVGANAHMGRNGELVISRYTDHGYVIGRDVQHLGGVQINYGGSVTYTTIVSGTDGNPVYSSTRTGNAITYTNPFITTAELDRVCDALLGDDGITVTPCNGDWRSDPCVDAGDIVSIEGADGTLHPVYVMERTVTITGGLSENLCCYGETETARSLNTSPLVTKLNKIVQPLLRTADMINNTKGTMRMLLNPDGTNYGYDIVEEDGVSWLRCTAGGLGLSSDGGLTYTNAITKNGVVATKLDVQIDGVSVLNTGLYASRPYFRLYDLEGRKTFEVWNTLTAANKSRAEIKLYDPNTGRFIFLASSGYVASTGELVDSTLRLYRPSDGKGGIGMESTNSNGQEFTIFNSDNIASVRLGIDANDKSYLWFDGYKMEMKTVTIDGKTYRIVAWGEI